MYPRIGNTLGEFHHRVDHQLMCIQTRRYMAVRWIYPCLDAAMTVVDLEEVDTYALCQQNNVAQYTKTHLILELCMVAERQLGARENQR